MELDEEPINHIKDWQKHLFENYGKYIQPPSKYSMTPKYIKVITNGKKIFIKYNHKRHYQRYFKFQIYNNNKLQRIVINLSKTPSSRTKDDLKKIAMGQSLFCI